METNKRTQTAASLRAASDVTTAGGSMLMDVMRQVRVGLIVSKAAVELHAGHDAASGRHVAVESLLNRSGAIASIKD